MTTVSIAIFPFATKCNTLNISYPFDFADSYDAISLQDRQDLAYQGPD